jgi:hypothetical protein
MTKKVQGHDVNLILTNGGPPPTIQTLGDVYHGQQKLWLSKPISRYNTDCQNYLATLSDVQFNTILDSTNWVGFAEVYTNRGPGSPLSAMFAISAYYHDYYHYNDSNTFTWSDILNNPDEEAEFRAGILTLLFTHTSLDQDNLRDILPDTCQPSNIPDNYFRN